MGLWWRHWSVPLVMAQEDRTKASCVTTRGRMVSNRNRSPSYLELKMIFVHRFLLDFLLMFNIVYFAVCDFNVSHLRYLSGKLRRRRNVGVFNEKVKVASCESSVVQWNSMFETSDSVLNFSLDRTSYSEFEINETIGIWKIKERVLDFSRK